MVRCHSWSALRAIVNVEEIMTTLKIGRRVLLSAAVAALTIGAPTAFAGGHQVVDSIQFIIPGGAGGV